MVFSNSTGYHLLAYLIYTLRILSPQYLSASLLHYYCTIASLEEIYLGETFLGLLGTPKKKSSKEPRIEVISLHGPTDARTLSVYY